MLNIDICSKQFAEGQKIISDLKINLEQGERIAIVAPSGAGKSTLMRILAGVDQAYCGSLSEQGISEYGEEPHWPAAGVMFQDARLLPWLTVEENLMLVAPEISKFEAKRQVAELLQEVGLGGIGGQYPMSLSGGMQRRVALARALMPQSRLLLLDEPLVSLDLPTVERLRKLILRRCQDDGISLVYVTHDLEDAIRMANRVLFLSRSPARLLHQEVIPENALSDPSRMTELLANLRGMTAVMEDCVSQLAEAGV